MTEWFFSVGVLVVGLGLLHIMSDIGMGAPADRWPQRLVTIMLWLAAIAWVVSGLAGMYRAAK